MRTRLTLNYLVGIAFLSTLIIPGAFGQGFNIDLDIFSGTEAQGNGAPSSSFGAAAGQAGYWNRISAVAGGLMPIVSIDEQAAAATINVEGSFGGGIGFLNPTNTGDYALLLNDAATVGTVVQGGFKRYTFSGLEAGNYDIYTYAVRPQGTITEAPITIKAAVANQTQVVTGPMPGNAFEYLVTHSMHEINLSANNIFSIEVVQNPGTNSPYEINGFQIVPVPETNSAIIVAVAGLYALLTRRRRPVMNKGKSHRRKRP